MVKLLVVPSADRPHLISRAGTRPAMSRSSIASSAICVAFKTAPRDTRSHLVGVTENSALWSYFAKASPRTALIRLTISTICRCVAVVGTATEILRVAPRSKLFS